ncbi:MAG TPA: hypothetical protein PKC24_13160 [Cyclobacteriaceae bacterium]|nr:hypothetical protein [Cyclobacteriaceae bacterium]
MSNLFSFSCSDIDVDVDLFRDDPSIQSLNGTWQVVSFEDYEKDTVEFKNFENSRNMDINISFDDQINPHKFSGKNISNSISGEFECLGKRQIKIHNFFTTFVAQPRWADEFIYALNSSPRFKINRYSLIFFYDEEKRSVTLERIAD